MSGIVGSKFNHRGSGLIGSLGTDGQHMLSAGAGKTNVFETVAAAAYDDEPIKSDLTLLALREATNSSSVAFNLPSSFIETFTDDTNLGTQTDGDRISGYWGTAGATSVTDTTLSGDATRSSDEAKFGTYSLFMDGTGDIVTTGELDSIAKVITTGSWTIDYWFMVKDASDTQGRHFSIGDTGISTAPVITGHSNPSGVATSFNFYHYGDSSQVNTTLTGYPAIDTTTWWHHALQRDSSTGLIYAWLNGVYKGSFDHDTSLMPSTTSLIFGGRHNDTGERFDGHLDEFRISNTKRYTNESDFTPATSAYAADGNTTLLWHFEDTGIEDESLATVNATGTLIQSANSVTGSRTSVAGSFIYKDNAGTATLGTDLKIYFTANGGTNYTEAASYNAFTPVYASGIKMVRLGKTTVTGGTDVRYKAVWANQSLSSKETQLHGIGINY